MESVYIRTSPRKIIRRYLLLAFGFSPLLLMYYAGITSERNTLNPKVGWAFVALYGYILVRFFFDLHQSKTENIITLSEEGIKIYDKEVHAWESVYEIKILYKTYKTTDRALGKKYFSKGQFLVINGEEYNFSDNDFHQFTLEEVMEIMTIYKERMLTKKLN